jgi:outer membrane protein assembly factor BamB
MIFLRRLPNRSYKNRTYRLHRFKDPTMRSSMIRGLKVSLFTICLTASTALAENWPNWRGPNYDGVSSEKNLPAEFGDGKNMIWALAMPGMGSSTPVIWGDRIFLTSEGDNGNLLAICISTSGKELWRKTLGTSKRRARKDEGNDSSPTASTDGKYVWFYIGTGKLCCFDLDGKEIWSIDVQEKYGRFDIQFGMHTTPLHYDGKLYLQLIHTARQWVIALEAATGKEVWKVKRDSDGRDECEHSYASPCLWKSGDKAYLITHGNDYAIAHDLKDGHEIWRVGDLNGATGRYNPTLRFVASPVATPELIVVPTAKNGPVVGVKPDASGKVNSNSPGQQWRLKAGTPDVPSPLVKDGLVYLCRENGNMACIDAKSGEVYYTDQRTHNARYRASPVFAGDKIYITSRDGVITVLQPGKQFKVLATNKLGQEITASPAFSAGRIYIRTWDNLYAFGLSK